MPADERPLRPYSRTFAIRATSEAGLGGIGACPIISLNSAPVAPPNLAH